MFTTLPPSPSPSPSPLPSSLSSSMLSTTSTQTPRTIKQQFPLSKFDTTMALIILFLFSSIFFVSVFFISVRRYNSRGRRPLTASSSSSYLATIRFTSASSLSKQRGLDKAVVQSLPLVTYNAKGNYSKDCSICLCEFEVAETVKAIPYCGHVFHPECIDKWFGAHVSCPNCRSVQLFPVAKAKISGSSEVCLDIVEEEEEEPSDDDRGGNAEIEERSTVRRTSSGGSFGLGERLVLVLQRSYSM